MPKKKNQTPAADAVPFELAMERVETIVEAMESDALPLEEMLVQYEEGARLLACCQQHIEAAQKRVEIIESERDNATVTLKAFENNPDDRVEPAETAIPPNPTTTQTNDDAAADDSDEIRLF